MKLRYSAVPALLAAVFATASLPAAARSQMQCRHVQREGIESTYRCEAPGATIAQAYADFQARRYRYEAPIIDGVREEKIRQDGYLPHTLPKRSLKREGTEPNGCGGFRYYYHITRHNGGVRVKSGGGDDCVAGDGTETRYEKRGGKIIITHKVFAS